MTSVVQPLIQPDLAVIAAHLQALFGPVLADGQDGLIEIRHGPIDPALKRAAINHNAWFGLDQIDAAAKRVGTPDILFNCSGFVHAGTLMETDDKAWDFSFDLNVKAHFHMIKAFMPAWLARGNGTIINMASAASSIKGVPNRFVYGATKAAVIGMTKALAADYTSKGIRVNAICPGTVDSPSLAERLKATGDYEAAKSAFISRQPMGRMARAEEIGMLVVYLASDEAAFVTGQTFVIDGGWSI